MMWIGHLSRTTAAFPFVTLLGLLLTPGAYGEEPARYLFVSAPRTAKVAYVRLPTRAPVTGAGAPVHKSEVLIDAGLKSPMGLAVDQQRGKLFVADPEARKVYAYKVVFSGGKAVIDGEPSVAVQDIEARWVACDGLGNIFVSDEGAHKILKVPAEKALRKDPTATMVYGQPAVTAVSNPGGVALDNFHVYWANKALGKQVGSVVKGFESPATTNVAESALALTKNADKIYGVCLAKDNVFFTNEETYLYGVKKSGMQQATVSDKLQKPRGCAWDGDGTVFVADRTANQVVAFAGNMQKITTARIGKVIDFEDAFGVAVMSGARGIPHGAAALVFIFSALMWWW